jgi:hypothetical protein
MQFSGTHKSRKFGTSCIIMHYNKDELDFELGYHGSVPAGRTGFNSREEDFCLRHYVF